MRGIGRDPWRRAFWSPASDRPPETTALDSGGSTVPESARPEEGSKGAPAPQHHKDHGNGATGNGDGGRARS
jgi:hypothetical protein